MSHHTESVTTIKCDECGCKLAATGVNIPKQSQFSSTFKRLLGLKDPYTMYMKIYLASSSDEADLCYFCAANMVKRYAEEIMADMLEARQ